MNKLSRKEASQVIIEARRLQVLHTPYSRMGQSIWWCSTKQSTLPEELQEKLYQLIDQHRGTELDFYHFTDGDKVIELFYQLYVENI